MRSERKISRRNLLRFGLLGSGALLLPAALKGTGMLADQAESHQHTPGMAGVVLAAEGTTSPPVKPFQVNLPIPAVLQPVRSDNQALLDPTTGQTWSGTDYYQ